MELYNILIDPKQASSTCFLCFKREKNMTSIYENFEILDKYITISISLSKMMKNMFPAHDILLEQACNNCIDIVVKMYIILKRNEFKRSILSKIIDILYQETSRKKLYPGKKGQENVKIKLNLPKYEDIALDSNVYALVDNKKKINVIDSQFKQNSLELSPKQKITLKSTNKATICDICGKLFKNSNALKAHLNCHKQKQCHYCLKILKSHSHFNVHIKQHESNAKRLRNKVYYNCNECTYRSLNKKTLEAHINKMHLCRRPYVCQKCFKGFYKKSNLTEHESTHRELKNITCEICGDNFVSKKTLFVHMKLHSDEKLFICDLCGKKFATSGQRLEHLKRNHMEKMEQCFVCGKKYSLKKDLNRHMKKVHSEKAEKEYSEPVVERLEGYIGSNVESGLHYSDSSRLHV